MPTSYEEVEDEVLELAKSVIKKWHPDLRKATIGYVFREGGSLNVWADVCRLPAKFQPYVDMDYLVCINKQVWDKLSPDNREALLDHELCHCVVDAEGRFRLRKHDVEEFTTVIERWGLWRPDLAVLGLAIEQSNAA